jgi:hypothetical protein
MAGDAQMCQGQAAHSGPLRRGRFRHGSDSRGDVVVPVLLDHLFWLL